MRWLVGKARIRSTMLLVTRNSFSIARYSYAGSVSSLAQMRVKSQVDDTAAWEPADSGLTATARTVLSRARRAPRAREGSPP